MLSNRVLDLKASPTLALATKAKELEAQGKDVIALSLGEPDWEAYDQIKEAGVKAIHSGKVKYTPASGIPALRKVIAEVTSQDTGNAFTAENVAVSPGGKFIIYSLLQTLVDPNDEVIMGIPYWVSYPSMVELAQGKNVLVDCTKRPGMKLLADDISKAITAKSKVIILNSPSNPTGAVHTMQELKDIAEVIRKNPRLVLLSDDIYNRLLFKGGVAPHILQVAPDLKDRVVLINGVSKTFAMTGWRLGWTVGPETIIKATSNFMSQAMSCSSYISQAAALEALQNGIGHVPETVKDLKVRCDTALDLLSSIKSLKFEKPDGAFYLWVDIRETLGKKFKGQVIKDSRYWSQAFLSEYFVAVVPGLEFGVDGFIRLSFVLEPTRMKEAFKRMESFVGSLA